MKNLKIILYFILIVIIGVVIFSVLKKNDQKQVELPPKEEIVSILGCYVARIDQDVYTMNIQNENGETVSGTLDFDNFEKDSSSGVFTGTYKDGILLGDYSFRSEGMDSLMQVIFKKLGDDFVRGYGEVNQEGNSFLDPTQVEYDSSSPLSLFKKEPCA